MHAKCYAVSGISRSSPAAASDSLTESRIKRPRAHNTARKAGNGYGGTFGEVTGQNVLTTVISSLHVSARTERAVGVGHRSTLISLSATCLIVGSHIETRRGNTYWRLVYKTSLESLIVDASQFGRVVYQAMERGENILTKADMHMPNIFCSG